MKQSILIGMAVSLMVIGGVFAYQMATRETRELYTNEQYQFSMRVPAGFAVREIPGEKGVPDVVVIQNEQGEGVQILISPFGEDVRDLSKERIRAAIPQLVIQAESVMQIGATHTGLLFTSNSEAFDGASREGWFVFKGNLYQLSTYARLNPLLLEILGTWKFYN